MRHSRALVMGLFVAAVLVIGLTSGASAAKGDQEGKGKNAPEVPITAGLPVVATLTGATAYVLARARTITSRRKSGMSRSESDTE